MKLRLGDTVIELRNITYAQKTRDHIVEIHFCSTEEPLKVSCGEDQVGRATYLGDADALIDLIETHEYVRADELRFISEHKNK